MNELARSELPRSDVPRAELSRAELPRCDWAGSAPDYLAYHDDEWGVPIRTDNELFERLSLEAFQSGLSWLTILRKRPAFRAAFAGFDIAVVAAFDETDTARLLADAGIVRNRAKIAATITNARAIIDRVPEGLSALLWSFAPVPVEGSVNATEAGLVGGHGQAAAEWVPRATSAESILMSKELKRRGFAFVGPTTAHSLMQAVGMVNDHQPQCFLADLPRHD